MAKGKVEEYIEKILEGGADVKSGEVVSHKMVSVRDIKKILETIGRMDTKFINLKRENKRKGEDIVIITNKLERFTGNYGRKRKRWAIFTVGQKLAVMNMRKNENKEYSHKDIFNHLVLENRYLGTYEQVHKYIMHLDVEKMMYDKMTYEEICNEFKRRGSKVTKGALLKYWDDVLKDREEYLVEQKEKEERIQAKKEAEFG